MKEKVLENRAGWDQARWEAWVAELRDHATIKQVVDWGRLRHPPLLPADMVTQDEFSHDILVPLGEGCWLVYDTT